MSIEKIKGLSVLDLEHTRRPEPPRPAEEEKASAGSGPDKAESANELDKAAADERIYLKRMNTELRFEADSRLKEVLVKIIDPETDEVIRQIPSEEMIAIRKRMDELLRMLNKNQA
ncbi:MAG: flagellar protein FlaG [Deltaproteobacteria bacterium]|nr:flagellar protein FlaG [Deltaproteobacteria bacterium]MBZ0219231.1 flagellar protein FlaG [Deltaproteobacteria bacterium]